MSWFDRLWPRRRRARTELMDDVDGGAPTAAPDPVEPQAADPAPVAAPAPPASPATVAPPAEAALPRFQSTAGDQLDRRGAGPLALARLKLRRAYTPSQPIIDPQMLAGRTAVLETLIRAIENQKLHVIIYGERGIGKTSLLHVLAQIAREARYLTVYISCGASANFDEVFRAIASEIPVLFHGGYSPTTAESEKGATLADLLPEGPVSPRTASEILAKVTGTRLLVLLDEFDRCERAEFRHNIAELIKDLSDRSVRAQLVIAGVAANLTDLIEHIPSIQRNIFALQAPKMTEAELRELVKSGEREAGVIFENEAVGIIISAVNGFPYLASLLSHHAAIAAVDDDRLKITAGDVLAALSTTLSEFRGRISKRSRAQIDQCVRERPEDLAGGLSCAAQLGGGRFSADDLGALQPDAAAANHALVERLAAGDLLIEAHDAEEGRSYAFQEESVPPYLWLLAVQARLQGGGSAEANPPSLP